MKTSIPAKLALPLTILLLAVLFVLTIYPGVGGRTNAGDSAKFQFIGEVLGVPHETGYPQYVFLNYFWTRLPLPGSLAYRVNLLSTACSLLAAYVFFLLARQVSGSVVAAVLSTWAVFLGRHAWAISTEAEVYALNLVWVSAVLLAAYRWRASRRSGWLLALIAIYAISFGNHTSIIGLAGALLFLVLAIDRRKLVQPRWIAAGLLAIAIGISQYGLLLWRAAPDTPYVEVLPRDAELLDLKEIMLAPRFTDRYFLVSGWTRLLFRGTGDVLREAHLHFLFPALIFAVVGAALLWKRDRILCTFLALAALGQAFLAAAHEIPDWQVNCLPLWLTVGLFAAVALGHAVEIGPPRWRWALLAFCLPLAVVVAVNFQSMRVEDNPHDRSLLIEAAGADATIITHPRPNYFDIQVDNYYRLALKIDQRLRLRLTSAEQAFARDLLFLKDEPIYFKDGAIQRYFLDAGVDFVEYSPNGDLADWVKGLPLLTVVAVTVTDVGSPAIREKIAAALRPLGLSAALLRGNPPYYAGLSVKGPVAQGLEVPDDADAVLEVRRNAQAFRELLPDLRPRLRFPWTMRLYAGQVGGVVLNQLIIDDHEDVDRRPGMRAFAIRRTEEPSYESVHIDSRFATSLDPYYFVTGTDRPVHSLTIAPGEDGLPEVRRDRQTPISRGEHPLEIVVVGCRGRRVKGIGGYDMSRGNRGIDGLARLVSYLVSGDWVALIVRSPLPEAIREPFGDIVVQLGLASPEWESNGESLVLVTRVGSSEVDGHAYFDSSSRTVDLSCDRRVETSISP